jgi:hypothetical protein
MQNETLRPAPARSGAKRSGGARRSRTDDILLAKQALYQLSYGPTSHGPKSFVCLLAQTGNRVMAPRHMDRLNPGWPGQTRTVDLTLIRRTL